MLKLRNIRFILIIIIYITIYYNYKETFVIENKIVNDIPKYDYFMKLEISKINLNKFIVNDEHNNIEENVTYHNKSSMPDIDKGNLILMAHSGNASISYFKDIHLLESNDGINIYYQNKKYEYKIEDIYIVKKTGKVDINRQNKTSITLITCINLDDQLVIIGYLENITLL